MNREEWDAMCADVRDEMRVFVSQFMTPISASPDMRYGWAEGTGNYVRLLGSSVLVTNEHVARIRRQRHLAHLPIWGENYRECVNFMSDEKWPVDAAVMRLDSDVAGPNRAVLSSSKLGKAFSPADGELLFWIGFPGSTAGRHDPITETNLRKSVFDVLHTVGVPFLIQQWREPLPALPRFDENFHFLIYYPTVATEDIHEPEVELPNPRGMSGSFVWDTKAVACHRDGITWNANRAEVCGLLWAAHNKPEVVVATRIEYVRESILRMLREEYAYFQWVNRGRPLWDALTDWRPAEEAITDLRD
jgi:hypothetical protein